MKRLLILLLLLLLTACGAAPADEAEPETSLPEMPIREEPEERFEYRVEILRFGEQKLAEDGTPLLDYAVQIPVLTAFREDGTAVTSDTLGGQELTEAERQALAVAAEFNETFAAWTAEEDVDRLLELAEEELAWYQEEGFPWRGGYLWGLDCSSYQTERMLSISGLHYSYTGGAHPNTWHLSWNFDLEEGLFLEPQMLGEGNGLQEAVTAEIIRQAGIPREDGTVPAEEYWDGYEEIAANWSNYAVTFDEAGMCVVFSPYELAPYAYGPQEFRLSYEWLEPHLGDYGRTLLGLKTTE